MLAYGFEDLTSAEWALIEALAARTDVTVSIPYEPGRPAFAALERTVADLAGLAAGAIVELPPATRERRPAALVHLERELFGDSPPAGIPLDGSVHFLEGAGARGTVELIAGEILGLVRAGTPPERIGVVCESVERWRGPFETVLGPLGVPYAIEQRARLGETALGGALLALLRFDWLGGGRAELFAFLRSPFSGLERRSVDYVEGRLRGRAIVDPARVEEEAEKLRGAPVPALAELRAARASRCRRAGRSCGCSFATPGGSKPRRSSNAARGDARAYEAVRRALDELEAFERRDGGGALAREDVVTALERTTVRPVSQGEAGRVAVLDYARARTRSFDAVVLLGLEEGSLPRRERPSPLLDDDARRDARRAARAAGRRRARPLPLLHRLHARGARGSCSSARPRPTRAPRASRARSGTTSARSSHPRTSPARPAAARSRASRGRSRPRRANVSACARVARLSVADEDGAAGLAAANGWSRRLERRDRGVRAADVALEPGRSRVDGGAGRPSRRPSSSASRTARQRGSSSA